MTNDHDSIHTIQSVYLFTDSMNVHKIDSCVSFKNQDIQVQYVCAIKNSKIRN